jgi:N utilization substance protein A
MATKKKKKTQSKKKISRRKPVVNKAARKTARKIASTKRPAKKSSKASRIARVSATAKSSAPARASSTANKRRRKNSPAEKLRVFRSSLPTRGETQGPESKFEPKGLGGVSAGQSGDLQGLSNIEGADSESVGELLEEGNAFEAEVIKGVQDAPDADEGEVTTHQRPQDELIDDFNER